MFHRLLFRSAGLARLADGIGILLSVAAILSFFYDWDPSRIYYKRLKAENAFVYDDIRPEHATADPSRFVTVRDEATRDALRAELRTLIWGPDERPESIRPTEVLRDVQNHPDDPDLCDKRQISVYAPLETLLRLRCQFDLYADVEGLAGIDELVMQIGPVYRASTAFFRPKRPNGILIVYQNGYASTYHHQYRHIQRLVDAGYTVAANNHTGYGDNLCIVGTESEPWCEIGWGTSKVPLPLRAMFSPLAASIGHALDTMPVERVALIGFSAGGWISAVMAAADPRVDFTYPVAAMMPRYLQEDGENPPNQSYPPYVASGSLLDQFVLGADRPGRREVQFYNRYDRCCYGNTRALLFAPAVEQAVRNIGGGTFEVRIDETHARHKISRWTMDAIMQDIKRHARGDAE